MRPEVIIPVEPPVMADEESSESGNRRKGREDDEERVRREIRIPASMTADLDSGLTGQGDKDDVWFHIVDNNNMYVEAVNGANGPEPPTALWLFTSDSGPQCEVPVAPDVRQPAAWCAAPPATQG